MRRSSVLAATLVLLAAGQVGAACWNTDTGGWLLLEVGESRGWVIPVMGTYLPPAGPACLGHRSYPTHGIAQVIGDQVLLGLTISAEANRVAGRCSGSSSSMSAPWAERALCDLPLTSISRFR